MQGICDDSGAVVQGRVFLEIELFLQSHRLPLKSGEEALSAIGQLEQRADY